MATTANLQTIPYTRQTDSNGRIGPSAKQVVTMRFTFGNGDTPLPGYTIKRGVGTGGFGEVYFAVNEAGKEVALKKIQRNLDIEIRGVRHVLNLKHPNLISLYDIRFDQDNQGWIVMEFVQGIGLREAIDRAPNGMTEEEVIRWFGQIAAGVTHLHDHGIVHRDLKPANIFEDRGIIKIGDYGLSKFISSSRRGAHTESVGTFHYMAPEVGKGEYGKEIDIYALGIILYEMLTGEVPFDGESSQEIIMKHLTADPNLSRLPSPYREVVGKALQKNPTNRYRDIREMLQPLGLAIDSGGMVTKTSQNNPAPATSPITLQPLAPQISPTQNQAGPPPFITNQTMAAGNRVSTPSPVAIDNSDLEYCEPIARQIILLGRGVYHWWNRLPSNGTRFVLALVGTWILISYGLVPLVVVTPFLIAALLLYLPYYIIWWFFKPPHLLNPSGNDPLRSVTHPHPVEKQIQAAKPPVLYPVANFVPGTANVAPQPHARTRLTAAQIRQAQQRTLALQPFAQRLHGLTGSLISASIVITTLGILTFIFTQANANLKTHGLSQTFWTALTALLSAWVILGCSKYWETKDGDHYIRRFSMLTGGLVIGFASYLLSDFLTIQWIGPQFGPALAEKWQGFYSAEGPLLPAFLVHFALLFGLVRWWRQADPLRISRFSVLSVVGVTIAELLVNAVVQIPQPWGLFTAIGTSIAVQMSAPRMFTDNNHDFFNNAIT